MTKRKGVEDDGRGQQSIRSFFAPSVGAAAAAKKNGAGAAGPHKKGAVQQRDDGGGCGGGGGVTATAHNRQALPTAAAQALPPAAAEPVASVRGDESAQAASTQQQDTASGQPLMEAGGQQPQGAAAGQPPPEAGGQQAQQQQAQQQQAQQQQQNQSDGEESAEGGQQQESSDAGAGSDSGDEAEEGPGPAGDSTDSAAGTAGTAGGLTAYELERLERIRRNQEVMRSMGLGGPGIEPKRPAAPPPAGRPARKRPAAADEGAAGAPAPVRRSGRNRGPPVGGGTSEADAAATAGALGEAGGESSPEPELQYDDSSVRRYICEVLGGSNGSSGGTGGGLQAAAAAGGGDGGGGGEALAGARVSGFRQLPGCLHDPALARAYSVDWRPGLVVAGGKDGVVSVFGSRVLEAGCLGAEDVAPALLSQKLHKGWISDVQFVSTSSSSFCAEPPAGSSGCGDALLLLTAGNDATVCLWDLGRSAEAAGGRGLVPQCLAKATDLHSGGIFSLHESGGRILTASKDCTLAISSLGSGGGSASLAAVQRYDEIHEGVVKCARWRDSATFASCGNDRRICVVDTRQPPSAGAGVEIAGAHGSAINCLRWHPASDHLLLTASHDPHILLHDIRSPGQPLHRFTGHAQAPRISGIYQPAFVAGGDAIATSCERSTLLSLYCTRTGATISRGATEITVGATFCGRQRGNPLLCTSARAVFAFRPTWYRDLNSL